MRNATKRRERVYQFAVEFSRKHLGNFPPYKRIMDACQIPSTSTVSYYLAQLVKEGRIVQIDSYYCVAGSVWLPPQPETEFESS